MRVDVELRKIGGIENPPLTSREVEVLALLARGKSNATIASDLGIALKTVLNHMNHLLAKVDIPPWAAPRVYLALWYSKHARTIRKQLALADRVRSSARRPPGTP